MEIPNGLLIRELRRGKGLTQAQLADRAGVGERTLKRLEAGQSPNPHPSTIAAVAGALGIETARLLRSSGRSGAAPGEPLATPASALDRLPFVGRNVQLAHLLQATADASRGARRVVLIQGEPGAGKSRLLEEFAARLSQAEGALARCELHVGHCSESPGSPPFWPWVQILRSYIRPGASPDRAFGRFARHLEALLPEVAVSRRRAKAEPRSDQERFRLYDAVDQFLRGAAERIPQVVVVDDLHCADEASVLLFEFLARIPESPICLIAAYRPAPLDPAHPLLELQGGIGSGPRIVRVPLQSLERTAVRELLTRLDVPEPSDELIAALLEKTDGNPFYLSEVVQELRLREIGAPPADQVRSVIPESLQEVVCGRVSRLAPALGDVLAVASVEGRQFHRHLLARAAQLDDDAQLGTLLEAASRARLIQALPERGRYEFVHMVVRDAIYSRIEPIRRAKLHRVIGEAIEAWGSYEPQSRLSELAHHFLCAAQIGPSPKAARYAEAAAAHALHQLAFEEAARLYANALHVIEEHRPVDAVQVIHLLLALGDAQSRAGDGAGSLATFRRASAIARDLVAPALLAEALLGIGLRFGQVFDVGFGDREQHAALEELLGSGRELPARVRSKLLARVAIGSFYRGDPHQGVAAASDAVRIARASGDLDTLFEALKAQYLASLVAPASGASQALSRELQEIAHRTRAPRHQLHGQVLATTEAFKRASRWITISSEVQRMRALADRLREPGALWWAAGFEAALHALEGDVEAALGAARAAQALGERAGSDMVELSFLSQSFGHARLCGGWEHIEASMSQIASRHPSNAALECALLWIRFRRSDAEQVRHAFEEWVDSRLFELSAPLVGSAATAILAELCFELRDAKRARALKDLLEPITAANIVAGLGAVFYGPTTRYLGLLAAAAGDVEEASRTLSTALGRARMLCAHPWALQIELDLLRIVPRSACDSAWRAQVERLRARASTHAWKEIQNSFDDLLEPELFQWIS
jgi:transcriptional regulator with XRE-family HTH domain